MPYRAPSIPPAWAKASTKRSGVAGNSTSSALWKRSSATLWATTGLQDVGCATALERHLDLRVEVVPVEDLHVGLDLRAGMSKRSAMSRQ
ncbi:hypothetical protein CH313_22605 [Streptomyces sp. TSRI0384-2]|nr:hypothetical protein CH313_22605 [Streptomyces sp. TSRI0384-2]